MTSREPFFAETESETVRRLWSKQGSLRVTKRPEVALTAGVKSQEVRAETGSPGKQNWLGQVLLVFQCVVLLDKLCERGVGSKDEGVWSDWGL